MQTQKKIIFLFSASLAAQPPPLGTSAVKFAFAPATRTATASYGSALSCVLTKRPTDFRLYCYRNNKLFLNTLLYGEPNLLIASEDSVRPKVLFRFQITDTELHFNSVVTAGPSAPDEFLEKIENWTTRIAAALPQPQPQVSEKNIVILWPKHN